MWSYNWIVIGFQCDMSITLFKCYQPFHSNTFSESDSFEFIRLNLRENKQGVCKHSKVDQESVPVYESHDFLGQTPISSSKMLFKIYIFS